MTDYEASTAQIQSALSSIPYAAPELLGSKLESLMGGVLGLLRSLGYEVRAVEVVKSLTPMVGAEGGDPDPAVNQAEPGPESRVGMSEAPARASIDESEDAR